ncbi:hypothetical protein ABEF91_006508 [Exophiala dermatitidis]
MRHHPWPACAKNLSGTLSNVIHPETPCRTCSTAGAHCVYPVRDRNIFVSENYVTDLQAQIVTGSNTPGQNHTQNQHSQQTWTPNPSLGLHKSPLNGPSTRRPALPVLRDATAEAFVSGLKGLGGSSNATGTPPPAAALNDTFTVARSDDRNPNSQLDYVPLDFDTSTSRITIKLPPYPYAVQLVNQFETFLGYEYHWYMCNSFHAGLEMTYRSPHAVGSRDRIWLCKLLTVFALGESYNSFNAPSIELVDDARRNNEGELELARIVSQSPPGVALFEQALVLFKIPSEEPTVAHVEALNLIAFYCYSLNRRKTAYMYSGLAVRIATCLLLHKPAVGMTAPTAEHHKRVWWTTFQLDAMTAPEVRLKPTLRLDDVELALPADETLTRQDRSEFNDAQILAAHLKLCGIRSDIAEVAGRLQEDDFADYQRAVQVLLSRLQQWKTELPVQYRFEFDSGLPTAMLALPSMRSLASVYLRYHQGYIILMRPVFFKLLAIALGKTDDEASLDSLIELSSRCLEAAKSNMRIVMGLSHTDRIAKYGFWESLHIFSSVHIFSLAQLADTFRPMSLSPASDDSTLYQFAKDLLISMANHGNIAAKGHIKLIDETERLLADVTSRRQLNAAAMVDLEQDIFQWIELLDDVHYVQPTWSSFET